MKENKKVLERVGGYLILLVATLMLLWGWRISRSAMLDSATTEGDPSASTNPGSILEVTPFVLSIDERDVTPTAAFVTSALPVLTDDSLVPAFNPHTYQGQQPEHSFETYVVQRGDTPGSIAERFGIRPETLLGGNPQLSQESSLLQTGVELIILPIDGVLHDVQPGETLEGISAQYGIPLEAIIAYEPNRLEFPYRLYPGTQIMVPGAVRELFVWTPPSLEEVVGRSSFEGRGVRPIIVGTGTFVYPVGSRNFTQYFWYGHRGIDIALPEGSAVFASDTGTVTFAGWNVYGFGNLIVVNHGNGYETFYGHLSGINVVPGQIVYQGNLIGSTGNTGNSSGPHIHFEIRLHNNQDNPCFYIGC